MSSSSTSPIAGAEEAPVERRNNHEVRALFEEAYALIQPFFEWGGQPLEYLAFQRLSENYPKLSHENISIIISVADRVYRERHPDLPPALG